jgi:hypothetical protein
MSRCTNTSQVQVYQTANALRNGTDYLLHGTLDEGEPWHATEPGASHALNMCTHMHGLILRMCLEDYHNTHSPHVTAICECHGDTCYFPTRSMPSVHDDIPYVVCVTFHQKLPNGFCATVERQHAACTVKPSSP